MGEPVICFQPQAHRAEGLYLHLPDGSCVDLTAERIEKAAVEYWRDPGRVPPALREGGALHRCALCPGGGPGGLCEALRPILPFLDLFDRYVSFDKVTAIFRGPESSVYHVAQTQMQVGLTFVSLLSLMRYCQAGRRYWRYYLGIIPLMAAREVAKRLFLNIFYLHGGDRAEVQKAVAGFEDDIRELATAQVEKLRLVCRNDAFVNAYANAQVAPALVASIEEELQAAFAAFEKV